MFKKLILISLLLTFPLTSLAGTPIPQTDIELEIQTLENEAQIDALIEELEQGPLDLKKGDKYSQVCEDEYFLFEIEMLGENDEVIPPTVEEYQTKDLITLCECNNQYKKFPDTIPQDFKNFCNSYIPKGENYCIYDEEDFNKFKITTSNNNTIDLSKDNPFDLMQLYNSECKFTKSQACSILTSKIPPICQSNPLSTITLVGLDSPNQIICNKNDPKNIRCNKSGKIKIFDIQDTFDTERFDTSNLKAEGQGDRFTKSQDQTGTIISFINAVIDFLVTIASTIALVIFIIGCVILITSTGNTEQIEKGTAMIKYSIVGLLVVLLSYFLVIGVQSLFF